MNYLSQGHAEDVLLRHRYLYYVEHAPVISDAAYDALERAIRNRWSTTIANDVGSDDPCDYPVYVREGRRPDAQERAARDARSALKWLDDI